MALRCFSFTPVFSKSWSMMPWPFYMPSLAPEGPLWFLFRTLGRIPRAYCSIGACFLLFSCICERLAYRILWSMRWNLIAAAESPSGPTSNL